MNALVCMQAKKRRLHAVPSCGSDGLKLHFREGSVAGISPVHSEMPEVFPEVRQQAMLPISPSEVHPAAQVVQPEPL